MPMTPMKIRTLQRKLYAKAKQEPGYRFYALNDKVYRADLLQHAWRLVKSNKGAPGIDGVSFADIEAEEGVEQFLAELAAEVRVIPACGGGSLEESACLDMKHIGKPCTGERYARFDEGGAGPPAPYSTYASHLNRQQHRQSSRQPRRSRRQIARPAQDLANQSCIRPWVEGWFKDVFPSPCFYKGFGQSEHRRVRWYKTRHREELHVAA